MLSLRKYFIIEKPLQLSEEISLILQYYYFDSVI